MTALTNSFNGTYVLFAEFSQRARVDEVDGEGFTPLQRAASIGHWRVMDLLLYNGANPDKTHASDGRTAVHFAAMYGCDLCLASILYGKEHEEVVALLSRRDVHGMTALDLALMKPTKGPTTTNIARMLGTSAPPAQKRFRGQDLVPEPVPDAELLRRLEEGALFSRAHDWLFEAPSEQYMLALQYVYQFTSTRTIAHLPSGLASTAHVMAHFFRTGRPALITGNVTSEWGYQVWRSTGWNQLLRVLNNVPCKLGVLHTLGAGAVGGVGTGALRARQMTKPLKKRLAAWRSEQRVAETGDVSSATGASEEEASFNAVLYPEESTSKSGKLLNLIPSLNRELQLGARPDLPAPQGTARARDMRLQVSLGGGAAAWGDSSSFIRFVNATSVEQGRPAEASLHLQLVGLNEVFLVPQTYAANVTTTLRSLQPALHQGLPFGQWRSQFVPQLLADGVLSHTFMFAGDLLFVPRGYVFVSLPLTDAVSVSEAISRIVPVA